MKTTTCSSPNFLVSSEIKVTWWLFDFVPLNTNLLPGGVDWNEGHSVPSSLRRELGGEQDASVWTGPGVVE